MSVMFARGRSSKSASKKPTNMYQWKAAAITIGICVLLVNLVAVFHTRESRALFGIMLLSVDWFIFCWLLLVEFAFKTRSTSHSLLSKTVNWTKRHIKYAFAILAFSLLIIYQETHHLRLVNNLTIALTYCLLFAALFSIMRNVLLASNQELNLKNQKFYILYCLIILVCFYFSKDMDDRDPLGTQFQFLIFCWSMVVHLMLTWFMGQWRLVQQLKNEGSRTELMHLKSQINPHFFFNTLNNLYGLAREKSDATPEVILQLSEMMRYTIYQGQKDWVQLQEEIDYLQNYIQLQQIRFHKKVQVNVDLNIYDPTAKVPPLLFINLLENAYKHGVESLSNNAYVTIALTTTKTQLKFSITNNFDADEHLSGEGIGLSNLRKRLDLLYPNQHSFDLEFNTNTYKVEFTIPMKLESVKHG